MSQIHNTRSTFTDLIVGVYDNGAGVTSIANKLIQKSFLESDFITKSKWKAGKVRIVYNVQDVVQEKQLGVNRIAFVGLGKKNHEEEDRLLAEQYSSEDSTWLTKELVRKATESAVKALKKDDRTKTDLVLLDDFGFPQQAVEGSVLGAWEFEKLGKKEEESPKIRVKLVNEKSEEYQNGLIVAEAQNVARELAETPANLMTPSIFCKTVQSKLASDKLEFIVRDKEWAEKKGMNLFLSVARGSEEPPKILEIHSRPNKDKPIDLVLVGKGITFDAGGISLKPSAGMKDMKGDMGGAAAVVSAISAISKLGLPLNVVALAFLAENLPSGHATKPGDVITGMNKKTVEVDNTDAEGRLILADALCYAQEMNPKVIIDVATLTGAMVVALGDAATGVFTTSNALWKLFEKAGLETGDYVWRFPLFKKQYLSKLKSNVADLVNVGGRPAGSITAAVFLNEFIDPKKVKHYAHLDIAGSAMPKDGMSGRPTRALVEFAKQLANQKLE